jgi:DNA/RNA-binding domain of Phe-tRNA-synthetase-like protein
MSYILKANPDIFVMFPEYVAFVIYARGLDNHSSDEFSAKLLRDAEDKQRKIFEGEKSSSHSHISAWRDVYKAFGAKSSKYLCSVEALLGRTLKGQDLPTINYLVDLYNVVSINHVLPVGGEDWDYLTSDLTLTVATGKEAFVTIQSGEETVDYPSPGEVVWADSSGVTCRRWNWRQCHRTQLTTKTKNAYFVLDRVPPYSMESLYMAGEELMTYIKQYFPSATVSYEILRMPDKKE